MDIDSLIFAPNNSLATKIKNLDGVGMAMGQGGAGGWDLRPRPTWLLPFPVPASPQGAGQTTLSHPRPAPNTILYI